MIRDICDQVNCPSCTSSVTYEKNHVIVDGKMRCYGTCDFFNNPGFSKVSESQCCYICPCKKKCSNFLEINELSAFIATKKVRQYIKLHKHDANMETIGDEYYMCGQLK